MDDANDQQVHLVSLFFESFDFCRVQVETRNLAFDDPAELRRLLAYGRELGANLLNDVFLNRVLPSFPRNEDTPRGSGRRDSAPVRV